MEKDWSFEFAQAHEGLGKLNQQTKESNELRKDPAAYL